MPNFQLNICPGGANCGTCRDRVGGRHWRQSAARFFEMPKGGDDFECPSGKLWGAESASVPADAYGLGDLTADIIKAVGADRLAKLYERVTGNPCGCSERAAKLNRLSARLRSRFVRKGKIIGGDSRPHTAVSSE